MKHLELFEGFNRSPWLMRDTNKPDGKILIGFFADGGNPPVNKPSIVGERGPELFVPKTAGTVIPNGAMGGGQQVVNNNYVYNVSAIDAKSVASFFAENRKTMLGTMQMAQKELPYGNR